MRIKRVPYFVFVLILFPSLSFSACSDLFSEHISVDGLSVVQSDIPRVSYRDFKFSKFSVRKRGANSFSYRKGKHGDESVFCKHGGKERILKEARWLVFLNSIGLGAKLFGVGTNPENQMTFISVQFSGGRLIQQSQSFPIPYFYFKVKKEVVLTEMERVVRILTEHRVMALDLQFLVRRNGALTLIDPGAFTIARPSTTDARINLVNQRYLQYLVTKLNSSFGYLL